jgi:hypothetical protein
VEREADEAVEGCDEDHGSNEEDKGRNLKGMFNYNVLHGTDQGRFSASDRHWHEPQLQCLQKYY